MLYRLFIAAPPNEEMTDALRGAVNNLKAQSEGGAFTRPENFHLTLAFIGETPRVKDAVKVTEETCFSPFEISLGEIFCFPNRNPKNNEGVYCVSVKGAGLIGLNRDITQRLNKAGFGIRDNPFVPHITLGRRVVVKNRRFAPPGAVFMPVNRVSLMKSERLNGILHYTELCQSRLFEQTKP